MQAHVEGGLLLHGCRVAHVKVTLLVLQPGDLLVRGGQVSPHALVLRLKAAALLLLPHHLPELRLQRGGVRARPAGLAARLLQLLLHPRHRSDQVLGQLRVLDQPAEAGRFGAGFVSRGLSVQRRVMDHQALQQGHSTVPALGPQQVQHVAGSHAPVGEVVTGEDLVFVHLCEDPGLAQVRDQDAGAHPQGDPVAVVID